MKGAEFLYAMFATSIESTAKISEWSASWKCLSQKQRCHRPTGPISPKEPSLATCSMKLLHLFRKVGEWHDEAKNAHPCQLRCKSGVANWLSRVSFIGVWRDVAFGWWKSLISVRAGISLSGMAVVEEFPCCAIWLQLLWSEVPLLPPRYWWTLCLWGAPCK